MPVLPEIPRVSPVANSRKTFPVLQYYMDTELAQPKHIFFCVTFRKIPNDFNDRFLGMVHGEIVCVSFFFGGGREEGGSWLLFAQVQKFPMLGAEEIKQTGSVCCGEEKVRKIHCSGGLKRALVMFIYDFSQCFFY